MTLENISKYIQPRCEYILVYTGHLRVYTGLGFGDSYMAIYNYLQRGAIGVFHYSKLAQPQPVTVPLIEGLCKRY